MSERITIGWIAWGIEPPYHHHYCVSLTWRQYQKYARLRDYESLSEAADYALKVGRQQNTEGGTKTMTCNSKVMPRPGR